MQVLDLGTGQRNVIGQDGVMSFAPRFAPNAGTLAMSIENNGQANIVAVDLGSRAVRPLTSGGAIDTSPSYSPDGSQIVFESDRGGGQQLYVMGADGGGARRISFGEGRYSTPVWSPKGDFIAFTKQRGGNFAIGIMKPDGSGDASSPKASTMRARAGHQWPLYRVLPRERRGRKAPYGGHHGPRGCADPTRRISHPTPPGRLCVQPDERRKRGRAGSFLGGQDSATCLAWALARFGRVETVGFDYGQRHRVELECRAPCAMGMARLSPKWRARLDEDHSLARCPRAGLRDLPHPRGGNHGGRRRPALDLRAGAEPHLPRLRGRARLAAGHPAYRHGRLRDGLFRLYPDCRDDTIKAMQVALNLGMERRFVLHTPLMWIDKAETWQLAESLGGENLVELIRRESHSCYLGTRDILHDWGYGCGHCPACDLRAKGFARYRSS